jgi:uncharacterized Zn-binding protein involved in type VI secretion
MKRIRQLAILTVAAAALTAIAAAEDRAADCPGFIVGGGEDVKVEGNPAAAVGVGTCVIAVEGSKNVKISGRGALRVGDRVTCLNGKSGVVVGGATNVKVNGIPLAGAGAQIVGCED